LVPADAKACAIARNRLVEGFPEQSKAVYRLFCYALDPERRHGGGSVREYARLSGLCASSVASTWFRAAQSCNVLTHLYSPKYVLTRLALVRVRALLETRASFPEVARYRGFSSPQALGRTIRVTHGVTPFKWRTCWDARAEFEAFVRHLIPFAHGLSLISDAGERRLRTTASSLDHLPPLRMVAEGAAL
jgi:AraC-like DNA-binding protein